jgi:SAM-dependent methyltransferase
MRDHQRRWDAAEAVDQFDRKSASDFFRSEKHFLDRIAKNVDSVLDVGCAAGRLLELFKHYGVEPVFTGIDVSTASLARARAAYPAARFIEGDAVDCTLDERFNLVNATGVLQHEPRFEDLIQRMLRWSSRYVLFDVKFARLDNHLVDIERAYSGGADRLYFIALAPSKFIKTLQQSAGSSAISIFGYETATNARTVVPADLGPIVSAGVLIDNSNSGSSSPHVELPSFLFSS